jgi:MFS family permease
MVVLDNLVVSVALSSIHRDFGSSVQSLEWTVNSYTLCYAVFLLSGATFGDRFGRRTDPTTVSPVPRRCLTAALDAKMRWQPSGL